MFVRSTVRAGAAAFAVGLSLAGPQALGVAMADDADATSAASTSSAPSAASRSAASRTATRPATRGLPAASRAAGNPALGQSRTANSQSRLAPSTRSVPVAESATGNLPGRATMPAPAQQAPRSVVTAAGTTAAATGPAIQTVAPWASAGSLPTQAARVMASAAVAAAPGLLTVGLPADPAAPASNLMASLLGSFQSLFSGFGLVVRRNFFNQAPTVNPVQLSGQSGGLITGSVGAIDPEQDSITYQVTQAPQFGSVVVASDGSFTYTPGNDFIGTDSFNVAASDGGRHLNLLDLRRPASTEAFIQVSQGAGQPVLTFNFVYGSGSQYWTTEARNALQSAAMNLSSYFVVSAPVTLTFDVTGNKSILSSTLATAGSDLVSDGAGFFNTVVQEKVLTGVDANGSAADGEIDWNFGQPWAFGSVGPNQYDFTSTVTHELVHTFGFLSNVGKAGSNTGQNWTTFDSFVVTANGSTPFNSDFTWNTDYNSYLTSHLYFGGPNAEAVYGGPVPLYTPSPWQSGSSMSHLNDNSFYGINEKLMNANVSPGRGVSTLSPVELAILEDLGYTVTS